MCSEFELSGLYLKITITWRETFIIGASAQTFLEVLSTSVTPLTGPPGEVANLVRHFISYLPALLTYPLLTYHTLHSITNLQTKQKSLPAILLLCNLLLL
ncbi:hypothetical protein ILYODFUR_019094 [Ilyodon furcidens]|uniref:Uncharacterized protein n=1 Tax=Ilyodon furcidens TaxID=33524 RepID=A0ABV0UX71_9TELE